MTRFLKITNLHCLLVSTGSIVPILLSITNTGIRYYRPDNLASMSTFMPSAERALFTFVNCFVSFYQVVSHDHGIVCPMIFARFIRPNSARAIDGGLD